jgi:dephospho-CoA kinase
MFNHKERVDMMETALRLLGKSVTGTVGLARNPVKILTADHARMYGFDVIIKGARTNQDFDYEKLIHEVSLTQQHKLETVLLFSAAKLSHVSSSAVKELAKYQGLIHEYVPIHVKAGIENKLVQRIIGVTGTIGSGKSTLCKKLARDYGAHHINMDAIAHELLTSNLPIAQEVREKIKETFGTTDRKELGDIVFGNDSELKRLNAIYREPMLTMLREKLSILRGPIVLEGALLVELGWLFLCNNRMIVVKTPSEQQHRSRLSSRGYSPEQMQRRIDSQYTYDEKYASILNAIGKDLYGKCIVFDTEDNDNMSANIIKIGQFVNGTTE